MELGTHFISSLSSQHSLAMGLALPIASNILLGTAHRREGWWGFSSSWLVPGLCSFLHPKLLLQHLPQCMEAQLLL